MTRLLPHWAMYTPEAAGTFTLFRNGRALDGHWWRGAADQPFRYEDASGAALPFAPGRTWIVLATQTTTTETG